MPRIIFFFRREKKLQNRFRPFSRLVIFNPFYIAIGPGEFIKRILINLRIHNLVLSITSFSALWTVIETSG